MSRRDSDCQQKQTDHLRQMENAVIIEGPDEVQLEGWLGIQNCGNDTNNDSSSQKPRSLLATKPQAGHIESQSEEHGDRFVNHEQKERIAPDLRNKEEYECDQHAIWKTLFSELRIPV